MSVRRRSSSKKRKRRSRSFTPAKRRISFGGGGGRLRSRNRRTAGFLGIEIKYYDSYVIGSQLTTSTTQAGGLHNPLLLGIPQALNNVAQGDGEQERDGRKMMMRSISINGHLNRNAIASGPTDLEVAPDYFIALVLDTQANGAVLNSQDVYTNVSSLASLSTSPFRNLQYSQRFKVLATRRITGRQLTAGVIDATGTGSFDIAGQFYPFRFDKKLAIPVLFTGTNATVANVVDNTLSILAWTSNNTNPTQISYNARLRFVG